MWQMRFAIGLTSNHDIIALVLNHAFTCGLAVGWTQYEEDEF
jgi:hypothetical protein